MSTLWGPPDWGTEEDAKAWGKRWYAKRDRRMRVAIAAAAVLFAVFVWLS